MYNTITYTLEDAAQGYGPGTHRPLICDACEMMLHPRRGDKPNWKSYHALKNSRYHFTHIDYVGSSTDECWCCHTRRLDGRHLVEVTRKAA